MIMRHVVLSAFVITAMATSPIIVSVLLLHRDIEAGTAKVWKERKEIIETAREDFQQTIRLQQQFCLSVATAPRAVLVDGTVPDFRKAFCDGYMSAHAGIEKVATPTDN